MTIPEQLEAWRQHPGEVDEDGYTSPTLASIEVAKAVYEGIRVIDRGDGGIVLRCAVAKSIAYVRVAPDGSAGLMGYHDGHFRIWDRVTYD